MSSAINVLAVDDEALNLDIIGEYLESANMNCIYAADGVEALSKLEASEHIDVIVLDRMMPNMDGMEFLKRIKADSNYKNIPVVMQTAATASHQIVDGITAGVFYYLSKPYTKEVFISIVRAANEDLLRRLEVQRHIREYGAGMSMILSGEFRFRTVEDAKALAVLISSCLPEAEQKLSGLMELMINSVEHGNLGITYEEKTALKLSGGWAAEVNRRLASPDHQDKSCMLKIEQVGTEYVINVKDQGVGFDWRKFVQFDPKRLTDPNGRGIMISNNCGFDSLKYIGNGNEFECRVKISAKE